MAYQSKNLSALGYANGFTLWHYRTEDTAADLAAEGYFNPASRMLRIGDFILLNIEASGEKPSAGVVVVTANSTLRNSRAQVSVTSVDTPTAEV